MIVKASKIKWDTDGEKVKLPSTLTFEVDEDFDVDTELADLMSDESGWLVKSFEYEIQ